MPRAQRQIAQAASWWDIHRQMARDAFDEDIAEAMSLLRDHPCINPTVQGTAARDIRILHLTRIRYDLFYRVTNDCVQVLAVWHSSRDVASRPRELRSPLAEDTYTDELSEDIVVVADFLPRPEKLLFRYDERG
jgi:plasmid stabilization system protein ParE